ncbi:MAG: ATPase/DNA packaging protein, partial [Candidatus Margulisiibacteriota bacterium]
MKVPVLALSPNINWLFPSPNMKDTNTFKSVIITGPRKSGKSFLMEHIYKTYLAGHYMFVILISPNVGTAEYNYFRPIPGITFIPMIEFNGQIIKKIADINASRSRINKRPFPCLVIMDDCGHTLKYNDEVRHLFIRG